mmetsp:Transcript_53026/g.151871  ORF Transcript_53026/g.151871 Transcript_53026/m.151871 type:complete len:270 (+) Transcript_53026:1192-2001(+)
MPAPVLCDFSGGAGDKARPVAPSWDAGDNDRLGGAARGFNPLRNVLKWRFSSFSSGSGGTKAILWPSCSVSPASSCPCSSWKNLGGGVGEYMPMPAGSCKPKNSRKSLAQIPWLRSSETTLSNQSASSCRWDSTSAKLLARGATWGKGGTTELASALPRATAATSRADSVAKSMYCLNTLKESQDALSKLRFSIASMQKKVTPSCCSQASGMIRTLATSNAKPRCTGLPGTPDASSGFPRMRLNLDLKWSGMRKDFASGGFASSTGATV